MKIGSHLDLQKNQLQNVVGHLLASAPSSPTEGQEYYDTATHAKYVYNGTVWVSVDASKVAAGWIPNTALTTNPLARANHTGTQLAATISDLAATVQAYRLDQFAAPTADVSWNSRRITSLLDPSGAQDAATKNYVDNSVQSAAAGIDSKPSVRAVATSNVTLSGTQTIDGVALVAGDAVLCTAQTTASNNGVYIVASGAWTRRVQEDQTGEVTPGAFWFVEEGTTYGKTQWRCNNTGTITIGTTAITIVQFGAANMFSADGTTLTLTGQVFSARLGYGMTTDGSGIAINRTLIPSKYAGTITGDGTTAAFTVTHNLNSTDVVVMIKDSSGNMVLVDVTTATVNTITVTFSFAPANAVTYRVIVIG